MHLFAYHSCFHHFRHCTPLLHRKSTSGEYTCFYRYRAIHFSGILVGVGWVWLSLMTGDVEKLRKTTNARIFVHAKHSLCNLPEELQANSSEPSKQSFLPSHLYTPRIHLPLPTQRNCDGSHVASSVDARRRLDVTLKVTNDRPHKNWPNVSRKL